MLRFGRSGFVAALLAASLSISAGCASQIYGDGGSDDDPSGQGRGGSGGSGTERPQPKPVVAVTVQGDRFVSDGRPHFPATDFLGSTAERGVTSSGIRTSHVYFSEVTTGEERERQLSRLLDNSYNSIFLYTINENDYRLRNGTIYPITPFKNQFFGGGGSTRRNSPGGSLKCSGWSEWGSVR